MGSLLRSKREQGYLLLEAIICFALISYVLAGGVRFTQFSNEFYVYANHKKLATQIADETLEDLKRNGYHSLPTSTQTSTVDLAGISGTQTVAVSDVGDYKHVNVNVAWIEAVASNKSESVSMITVMEP